MQFDDWLEEQGSLGPIDFSDALAAMSGGPAPQTRPAHEQRGAPNPSSNSKGAEPQ